MTQVVFGLLFGLSLSVSGYHCLAGEPSPSSAVKHSATARKKAMAPRKESAEETEARERRIAERQNKMASQKQSVRHITEVTRKP